jgi:tetratricopeptide (TPR) repeat protein
MEKLLQFSKYTIICFLLFLFPLFFLPTTQEFFITNKFYFLVLCVLVLIFISTVQLLISKKLVWVQLPLDMPVILFSVTIVLSILISSPNKIQALLNPNFGLVMIFSLTVLYFYLSRTEIISGTPGRTPDDAHPDVTSREHRREGKAGQNLLFLQASSFILSLITITFFFQPFKNANLPQALQFLKNPGFTTLGNQLDLAIFLGFFLVYTLIQILTNQNQININRDKKQSIFNFSFLIFNLVALSLTLYSILKPMYGQGSTLSLQLPPFRLSWYAAIETLKNPLTAFFGVGVDNFASIFTRIKDFAYNQSTIWQINSFAVSRSTILHIFSEVGLFGLVAFGLLIFTLLKQILSQITNYQLRITFAYLFIIMLLFPPSLPIFFLLFITLASSTDKTSGVKPEVSQRETLEVKDFNFSELLPIYFGIIVVCFAFIAGVGYLLGRSYNAEVYFKKALDGFAKNDAKQVYDNMRQAIILNPYIERFRINFSQANLLIANNIASKKQEEITDQDKQNISQGIQAAIAEAKAAAALNPQKAGNWENLAGIYRNILNVAQGADVWTISAYQRAIIADSQNPFYRLNLGGVYYSLGNFDEAVKLFEQTVGLKPDWSNAHYNLAWALYQKKDYQRAASAMQNVSQLVDPKSEDYKKVQKDLEDFKKMLPKEEATAPAQLQPGELSLPTPPSATFSPKIQLPKEASPEAK